MREGFKILCFLIFHSGIKYDGKSLAPEILQNSKKNLERPPILACKLRIYAEPQHKLLSRVGSNNDTPTVKVGA